MCVVLLFFLNKLQILYTNFLHGIYMYILHIYIYIYKHLVYRDSWKCMLGYKIVPTTNLHYHFGYSCE